MRACPDTAPHAASCSTRKRTSGGLLGGCAGVLRGAAGMYGAGAACARAPSDAAPAQPALLPTGCSPPSPSGGCFCGTSVTCCGGAAPACACALAATAARVRASEEASSPARGAALSSVMAAPRDVGGAIPAAHTPAAPSAPDAGAETPAAGWAHGCTASRARRPRMSFARGMERGAQRSRATERGVGESKGEGERSVVVSACACARPAGTTHLSGAAARRGSCFVSPRGAHSLGGGSGTATRT